MKFILALTLLIFVAGPTVVAQGSDPDINSYITKINNGQGEQVRTEIPALWQSIRTTLACSTCRGW